MGITGLWVSDLVTDLLTVEIFYQRGRNFVTILIIFILNDINFKYFMNSHSLQSCFL